ncbi:MAG: TlpA family protein disulfide reductase [Bacteroidales bacterium]|nr:TlpA family protein disulfide reductase [Bacteroidales bacterium]
MKWIIVFWLIVFAYVSQGQSDRHAEKFLLKAASKNLRKSSSAYELVASTSNPDTVAIFWRKNKSDIFFGYDALIRNAESTAYYSLNSRFVINHVSKTIDKKKFLDPKKVSSEQGPFDSTSFDIYFSEFLRPDSSLWFLVEDSSFVFSKKATWFLSPNVFIEMEIKGNSENRVLASERSVFKYKRWRKQLVRMESKTESGSYGVDVKSLGITSDSISGYISGFTLPNNYRFTSKDRKAEDSVFWIVNPVVVDDFQFLDYRGTAHRLSDFRGKVVVLDFWYATCAPCIKASKYVEKMVSSYPDERLIVMGMNPIDSKDKIMEHYSKWQLNYNTLLCTKEIQNALKAFAYPTFIVIDAEGRMVYNKSGFSPELMYELGQVVKHFVEEIGSETRLPD